MTAAAAVRSARAHARHGWYRESDTSGYMVCPHCRERVSSSWHAWTKPAEVRGALVAALAEHLQDEHGQEVTR